MSPTPDRQAGNWRIRALDPVGDPPRIQALNAAAFGRPVDGLFDRLRERATRAPVDMLALVAETGTQLVGQVMFSPVLLDCEPQSLAGMGLGELAVSPAWQRRGIGSALVETGLAQLRQRGCPFVIVIGHPEYYPRFGFRPAADFGLRCQWPNIPAPKFMVCILDPPTLRGRSGVARYLDA